MPLLNFIRNRHWHGFICILQGHPRIVVADAQTALLLYEDAVFFDCHLLLSREFLHRLHMVLLECEISMLYMLHEIRRDCRLSPTALIHLYQLLLELLISLEHNLLARVLIEEVRVISHLKEQFGSIAVHFTVLCLQRVIWAIEFITFVPAAHLSFLQAAEVFHL